MASHHLPRSLLATQNNATAVAPSSLSLPPPPPRPFRPGVAVLAGALATVFSLTFLLLLYLKHCRRRDYSPSFSSFSPSSNYPLYVSSQRNSGLHRSVVDSLPLFRYSSLVGHPKQHNSLDCAVCLSSFQPPDVLRLLPRCRHAFHVECVDTWLDSHSSCPLCRSRVHPDDLLLLPFPPTRHSSAGENATATHNLKPPSQPTRVSVDGGIPQPPPRPPRRKDGLLPTTEGYPIDREAAERRFGHCIVVSGANAVVRDRWSDLRPSDMLFLRSEMILTPGGGLAARGDPPPPERCDSDITGVRVTGSRRAEEEVALRRWLSSAAARWLGAGTQQG